ncbi:nitrilase family protein [Flagellimonas eckloniae]|uniref:Omega-amidase YafV n=1 Tax=Flagellimonas eckloniae TaxID=346185 RepID=A0A0Q0WZH5_9FLAO|nr:nitrilase family protein [Allomuricauda eckloniae]KQC30838.1 amidohydrolase [Allomuricauda eckloniae]
MSLKLKIALVQSHLIWENPQSNREAFSKKIDSISGDVDLIILPEMFSTGFTMNPQNIDTSEGINTVEWMRKTALKKEVAIVGSIVFTENNKNFNRLFFVYPNGKYKSYDKKHAFTLAGEDQIYKAGDTKLIVDYKGFKICPLICYDLRFPVWARNVEDYDVLIYVANWPKPRIDAWDSLLKARAIENMSYCIGVNRIGLDGLGYEYSGHSATYDVLGNQLVYSEKEEILCTTLYKNDIDSTRNKLKFLEDRDEFNLI